MSRSYRGNFRKVRKLKEEKRGKNPRALLQRLRKTGHGVYHKAICDDCDASIVGIRFKCINCKDFDICENCYQDHHARFKVDQHDSHDPRTHTFIKCHFEIKWSREIPVFFPDLIVSKPEEVEGLKGDVFHEFVICDVCETCVTGRRFCCLQCEYDLCTKCEDKVTMHHNEHIFMVSPYGKEFLSEVPRIKDSVYKFPKALLKSYPRSTKKLSTTNEGEEEGEEGKKKEEVPRRVRPSLTERDYRIRTMCYDDLDRIVEIEEESFSFPYSRKQFFHMVEKSRAKKAIFPLVLEIDGKIAGYICFQRKVKWVEKLNPSPASSPHSNDYYHNYDYGRKYTKRVYYSECISLAVSPNFRRRGVAKALVKELIKGSKKINCKYISLNVSVHNIPAQRLYSNFGFKTVRWCVEYYNYRGKGEMGSSENATKTKEMKLGDARGDALKMKCYLDENFEKEEVERERKKKKQKQKMDNDYSFF